MCLCKLHWLLISQCVFYSDLLKTKSLALLKIVRLFIQTAVTTLPEFSKKPLLYVSVHVESLGENHGSLKKSPDPD